MIPLAQILEITKYNVIIKCPYCDKIHLHGKIEGERFSHCYIPLRNKKLMKQVEERKDFYNSNLYNIRF